MTTLEDLIQDLRHVSPPHLEEVRELARALRAKEEANRRLAEQLHEIFAEPDDLSAADWADIDAHMKRVRAELFTRPNPFLDDADAA